MWRGFRSAARGDRLSGRGSGEHAGARLRAAGHRIRARGPSGSDTGGEARQEDGCSGTSSGRRRYLHQHRHHPEQDAPGGGAASLRLPGAQYLRCLLPGEERHFDGGPAGPHRQRRRPRARREPPSATTQPGRAAAGRSGLRRPAQVAPCRPRRAGKLGSHRRPNRHRRRHDDDAREPCRFRWSADLHQRRDPDPEGSAAFADRHRRRRHRPRIRDHLRRARRQGHPRRQAAATAELHRLRDHRYAGLPDAAEPHDAAPRRRGQQP